MLDPNGSSRRESLAKLCVLVSCVAVVTLGMLALRTSTVAGVMLVAVGAACAVASRFVRLTGWS